MKDYPAVVQKQLSHLVDCNQRPQPHVRVDVEVVKFHIIREVPSKRLVLPAQRRLVHQCTHHPLRLPRGILHLSKQVPQQRNNSTDTAHPRNLCSSPAPKTISTQLATKTISNHSSCCILTKRASTYRVNYDAKQAHAPVVATSNVQI